MFVRRLYLFEKKSSLYKPLSYLSHPCIYVMACNEYRLEDAVFHTQATPTFHLEKKHFRIEAMIYEPILQATLKHKPRGFLPGT